MRLRSVWIGQYKNLRDFSIDFNGDGFIDIFVGKNGSGKSNFLEALIEIFDHLHESQRDGGRGRLGECFSYKLAFEIEGDVMEVEWSQGAAFVVNFQPATRSTLSQRLPDNILVYYSGQNDNVNALIARYEDRYRGRLRTAGDTIIQRFVGIGPACKKLLIVVLMLQPEGNLARQFLCRKLGILGNSRTVRIVLKRPPFAGRGDHDPFDEDQRFWGTQGPVRAFLDQLVGCIEGEWTPGSIYDREEDKYRLNCNLDAFRDTLGDDAGEAIFRSFDAMRIAGLLDDIGIMLTLEGLEISELSHFSDGQFQSVYVLAVSELFKRRNCLTLLDEPDAFLHPEWQFDFLDQVSAISAEAARTNHILLSSHSASTVAARCDSRIRMFTAGPEGVAIDQPDKATIVRSLSAGLITFSETEARLSVDFVLANTTGPVLFTEGISDVAILETAWEKLYGTADRPFEIAQAFDCAFLRNLMKRPTLYVGHPGRTFFALFDFDGAFDDWVQLGDEIEGDVARCLTRQRSNCESYAMLVPIAAAHALRNQVVRPDGANFGSQARFAIELLFYGVPGLEGHFAPDTTELAQPVRFIGNKVDFAQNVVPGIDVAHFESFRPIFDFIQAKIAAA
ncbi:MAG: AAA family ATPase [Pseudomonadota bacterium]